MASKSEAVAENTLYYQKLMLFSASLWCNLWTWISAVRYVSYIAVATIRIELSECNVLDKKKEKKKKTRKKLAILLLTIFIP